MFLTRNVPRRASQFYPSNFLSSRHCCAMPFTVSLRRYSFGQKESKVCAHEAGRRVFPDRQGPIIRRIILGISRRKNVRMFVQTGQRIICFQRASFIAIRVPLIQLNSIQLNECSFYFTITWIVTVIKLANMQAASNRIHVKWNTSVARVIERYTNNNKIMYIRIHLVFYENWCTKI